MITPDFRKKMADSWFSYLQIQICKEFEYLEKNKVKFSKRDWSKNKKKEGVLQHEYWRDTKSAVLSTKRVLKYANKYNTKAHILHISTKDEINLLRRTKKNIT